MSGVPKGSGLVPGDVAECPDCGYTFVVRAKTTGACRRCGKRGVRHWNPGAHAGGTGWRRREHEEAGADVREREQ